MKFYKFEYNTFDKHFESRVFYCFDLEFGIRTFMSDEARISTNALVIEFDEKQSTSFLVKITGYRYEIQKL